MIVDDLARGIGTTAGGQGLDLVTERGGLEIVILIDDVHVPDHVTVTTTEGDLVRDLSQLLFSIRSIN